MAFKPYCYECSTWHHATEPHRPQCKKCARAYDDDEDDDGFGTGLCYHCFEEGVEEYEERRRARIARENEY